MKYEKVGLVLGGGGAKGAYQVGVYKALYENHLTQDIQLFCGTSIGAINSVLFTLNNVDEMVDVWRSLNKDIILTKKKLSQYFDITKLKSISIYSRSGFINLLEDHISLDNVSKSLISIYAVATPIKNEFAQTVFQLNGESPQMIKDILLATSAIPGVFESVKIKGVYYMDGFRISNVPTKIAVTKGCDLVYVVPLGKRDNPNEESYPDTTIINFKHPSFDDLSFNSGTLGFDPKFIQDRIELGYQSANALIQYLRSIGVITVTKKEKLLAFIKRLVYQKKFLLTHKKYYSLEDIGIYRVSMIENKKELSEEEAYAKDN